MVKIDSMWSKSRYSVEKGAHTIDHVGCGTQSLLVGQPCFGRASILHPHPLVLTFAHSCTHLDNVYKQAPRGGCGLGSEISVPLLRDSRQAAVVPLVVDGTLGVERGGVSCMEQHCSELVVGMMIWFMVDIVEVRVEHCRLGSRKQSQFERWLPNCER